jgi:hypothetical protein
MQTIISNYIFGDTIVLLAAPEPMAMQKKYSEEKEQNPDVLFPYWAKVWPAAEALCSFLQNNIHYIQ